MAGTKTYAPRSALFLEGLLCALALGVLTEGELELASAILVAGLVALGWWSAALSGLVSLGFNLVGVAAALQAGIAYLTGDGCSFSLPIVGRVLLLLGMLAATVVGGVHAVLLSQRFNEVRSLGLGWFAQIELLTFLSTTAFLANPGLGLPIVIVGALMLGIAVGIRPQLAMWTVGVGMALISLGGGAYLGVTGNNFGCASLAQAHMAGFTFLVAWIPVGVIYSLLPGRPRRNRSQT